MKRITVTAALACTTFAACARSGVHVAVPGASRAPALTAFASEAELGAYLQRVAAQLPVYEVMSSGSAEIPAPPPSQSAAAPAAPGAPAPAAQEAESVTNVQHAGVDEGGIVKVHGDYLVMLRRGRLFTVAIGGNALRPVSAVDAFGPDVDPGSSWYDELLVSGDAVVVIGYSYARGGTEVGLFRIDDAGRLTHRSTYHLRSNDYFSSRNYASRLIDGKLIFYTPLDLNLNPAAPFAGFPAMRRWHRGGENEAFHRILPANRVFRAGRPLDGVDAVALHTVTVCDLAVEEMKCQGTAVLGPPGNVFYVSPHAVYVWVSDWRADEGAEGRKRTPSMVYRIPLDGGKPAGLTVRGSPVDAFSFLESADGYLNVLVRADADGAWMWHAERTGGPTWLLRVPLDRFGDGGGTAPAAAYRPLPSPPGHTFQNRFVGDYLLYGTGSGWEMPEPHPEGTLYAVRWADGAASPEPVAQLPLPHGVDRIEAMGPDAVVVGSDGQNLHFSAVRLGEGPRVGHRYVSKGASQGELRSHGFFYTPDSGILGLPIRSASQPGAAHLVEGSASILFLRNASARFDELGRLSAHAGDEVDDGCRASCVDWYGNARPLFLRGRILALMGYEIVEGRLDGNAIRELRRVSYAPRTVVAGR